MNRTLLIYLLRRVAAYILTIFSALALLVELRP